MTRRAKEEAEEGVSRERGKKVLVISSMQRDGDHIESMVVRTTERYPVEQRRSNTTTKPKRQYSASVL
jgi:hypothetical protein